MAGIARPSAERAKLILAGAETLGKGGPFSTIQLRDYLYRMHPSFGSLALDSIRVYISQTLTDADYYKMRDGRGSVWSKEPVEIDTGQWITKSPEETVASKVCQNIVSTLFYGFRGKLFTRTQAIKLILETCEYSKETAGRYVGKVLKAASEFDVEYATKALRAVRRGRKPVTSETLWEILSV